MQSITKDFEIEIIIGIKGAAITQIKETLSPSSAYIGSDIHPDLILDDMDQVGLEEWISCSFPLINGKAGVYVIQGSVVFSEDSADYSISDLESPEKHARAIQPRRIIFNA